MARKNIKSIEDVLKERVIESIQEDDYFTEAISDAVFNSDLSGVIVSVLDSTQGQNTLQKTTLRCLEESSGWIEEAIHDQLRDSVHEILTGMINKELKKRTKIMESEVHKAAQNIDFNVIVAEQMKSQMQDWLKRR